MKFNLLSPKLQTFETRSHMLLHTMVLPYNFKRERRPTEAVEEMKPCGLSWTENACNP